MKDVATDATEKAKKRRRLAWLRPYAKQLTVIAIPLIVIVLLLIGFRWPPENMTPWGRSWTVIAVIILLIAAIIYALKEPGGTGEEPMPRWKRSFLMAYLLAVGAIIVLMLVALASIDFPQAAALPEVVSPSPTPTPATEPTPPPTAPTPTPTPTPVVPVVQRIFPQSDGANPPTHYLNVYGKNFTDKSKIRFNSQPEDSSTLIDQNLLRGRLQEKDTLARGAIVVDVKNADGAISNAVWVPIEKPRVKLSIFFFWRFWQPTVTRELQLMLLVIFAGALGSYLHSIMSIADFIGSRKLKISWFWWYVTRPFLGMAMGLVFYAMLRGGFLVGTPADEKFVNPFGVIAIGTLVGMFSDKAAQKLGEVFDVVFRAAAPRPDKLEETKPVITKLDPNTTKAGSKDTVVKIIGEGLATVSKVKVNDVERQVITAVDKEVSFTLTKTDLATASTIKIVAIDAEGDTSGTANFEVTAAAGEG